MPSERFVEPEVLQALESVQEELRAEQRALESLPREEFELRHRLEELHRERVGLLEELEKMRAGPANVPRLPASLEVPFELRPWIAPKPLLREIAPTLLLIGVVEVMQGGLKPLMVGAFCVLLQWWLMRLSAGSWSRQPQWRFSEGTIEEHVDGVLPVVVPYAEVLDAEVRGSFRQHRLGVGSVLVRCKPRQGETQGQTLTLRDIPEPERLAEWIRSKRGIG